MPTILAVNDNNDLFLDENGVIVLYRDLQATLQACAHAVKAQFGEMVLAIDQGIPYLQTVWGGIRNYQLFEADIRAAILSVAGVTDIISFSLNSVGDQLNYSATINTIYGIGVITESIVNG